MSVALGHRRDAIDAFAVVLMIGLTFSWGINGVAVKLSNAGFHPVFVMFLRSTIGALCVLAWCRWRGIALFQRDGTLWAGLAAGVLFGIEFVLIFRGLDYTTVARSALMINSMPFWVLIGAHFVLGERMSLLKIGGATLAFLGVALVLSDELSLPSPDAIVGDVMCLAASVAWAGTILIIKKSRLADAGAEKVLIYQLAVSAVIVVPLLLVSTPILRDVTALAIGSVIFQATFIVAFTYLVWFWLMRRYPAAGLSSFAFLTPAFGVLLGGLLLGEPMSPRLLLALILIAAGIVIVNRPPRKSAPA